MGKHEIPQYYLRGFASDPPDESLIWQYDRHAQQPKEIPIKVAAQHRGFYPDDVESFLTQEIEAPSNPILDKLRAMEEPSTEEKWILARYVLAMSRRTAFHRNWLLENVIPEVLEERFPELIRELPEHRREIENLETMWKRKLPPILHPANAKPNVSPKVVAGLCLMTWRTFVTDGPSFFMTSDNPVFYDRLLGMGKPTSELTFPISTNRALWLTWRTDLKEGFFETTHGAVKEVNRRTAFNASRFVFYHRNTNWVSLLVSKKRHRLTHLI